MSSQAQLMNEYFSIKVGTAEGQAKVAEYGSNFVKDRLRENSFARVIIPTQDVTRNDCQVSENNDTLVKLVQLEPRSRAMTLNFRGTPTARIIRAPRASCSFFTIASEQHQKTEQELLAYDFPITKVIEENIVKDIQEIEDREFVLHCDAACQAMQAQANGAATAPTLNATALQGVSPPVEFSVRKGELARNAATDDATVRACQRVDVVEMRKMLHGNRLKAERILWTEPDFDNLLTWTLEDSGSQLQTETAIDGWKRNTVLGLPFVRTMKTDILRQGNAFIFTNPDFLGKFYVLNQTRFYIDKVANQISFQAWEDIAMLLANIAAVKKMEFYSADATVNNADSLLASFTPKAEDQLGLLNNQVDNGLTFPKVWTY